MGCNCIATIDAKLAERNTRIMLPIMLRAEHDTRPMIVTDQIETGRGKKKAVGLFATFCPFCGASYSEAAGPQEIATAPKDGTDILILAHGMWIEARYAPGEWSEDTPIAPAEYSGAAWVCFDDAVQFEIEETPEGDFHGSVTHWMPRPPSATPAKAMEARRAETGTGSVHDSAVPQAFAQPSAPGDPA